MLFDAAPPPPLWLPPRPAIHRVADKHLLQPTYLPANREGRRAALRDLVALGAITKAQAKRAIVPIFVPPPFKSAGAAISFIASAKTQNTSSSTSLVISKPSGVQSGDLLVAFLVTEATASLTWTGDTGWAELVDQASSPSLRIAYLVAGGSEPSSYTFTSSSNRQLAGIIVAYRHAAYDAVGTIATNTTQTASAITLTAANSTILAFFARTTSGTTWSSPTAGLSIIDSDSDGSDPSWVLYSQALVAAGSTGTKSATPSATGGSSLACVLVGLKPV